MAIAYYGASISPHIDRTPEGYLICRDVPINRLGIQVYSAGELDLEGDTGRQVNVYRLEEDVFSPVTLASFEGKDITRGHPPEMLDANNQAGYSKGHLENVRRDGDNTIADLIIKDPSLISDVENGVLREVSCGYYCQFVPYMDGFKQTEIIGNHLAVVPRGRAGAEVAIKDNATKGMKRMKKDTKEALYRFFGLAARDAEPEELEQLTKDMSNVLEGEPADKAQESEPTSDVMVERAPKGDDLGSKLDKVIEMLASLEKKNDWEEEKLSDESNIDEMINKLAGKESPAVPADENNGMPEATRDAAITLLKKVRPVIASIENKAERAKITDALLGAIKGDNIMSKVVGATMDSARQTSKKSYDQICAESENAYAARNPHKKEAK